jgi:hypothetical protein
MSNTNVTGHKRPTLSEQINRLDTILDSLADNLKEGVALAVREAIASAMKEAFQGGRIDVQNHPELADRLRLEAAVNPSHVVPFAPPVKAQGCLVRLADVAKAVNSNIVNRTRRAPARVTQLASSCWKMFAGHLSSGWSCLQVRWQGVRTYLSSHFEMARKIRKPLLIVLGMGSVFGLTCHVAEPIVATAVSGLAGFAGAQVASAGNALRRGLASIKNQNT